MREKYSIQKIKEKSPRELIDEMSQAQFSLLRSFGCGLLNFKLFWVRLACLFFINIAEKRADKYIAKHPDVEYKIALKYELGKIFQRGAPSIVPASPGFPNPDYGFVIGFNHPSLGEVIRLMGICMLAYPERDYLFPVNVIWFEALAPIMKRLSNFGFTLMPIITPSASDYLLRHNEVIETRVQIKRLMRNFSSEYVKRSVEFVNNKQIVLVAPSARRRTHIFASLDVAEGRQPIEPQTMTLLAMSLIKAKVEHFAFLPVAVIAPEDASRGLNLLRSYKIIPCHAISEDMAKLMCETREQQCDSRRFERYFLDSIANVFMQNSAGDRVIGPN